MTDRSDGPMDLGRNEAASGNWSEEYISALRELAARSRVSPEELHNRIAQRIADTRATPECLTVAELDAWIDDALDQNRRAHVAICPFCANLLQAMSTDDPVRQRSFVSQATGTTLKPGESAGNYRAGLAVGITAGVVFSRLWSFLRSRGSGPRPDAERPERSANDRSPVSR